MIEEDNQNKINFLTQSISLALASKDLNVKKLIYIQKIGSVKRLPWTRAILDKTSKLAFSLLDYAD